MSSTFLNQIGLGEFDMGYLLIGMGAVILLLIIFLILLIVQIRKTSKLKKRLDKFLSGKDGASLEKDIAGLYEDNKFLKANTEKNKKDIRTLYKNMESAYQKMGLVKYDAFSQMGGQLSFHWLCWMRIIMVLLSILYTVPKAVILIQKKSNLASVLLIWGQKKQKHLPWQWENK